MARIRRTCRREGINYDCQVWLQARKGNLCPAQANLFLNGYESCQATREGALMETPQEVQEHYAACAVVNTFASNARPCQLAQLGDDYHRITHTHAERFYLGRAVNPRSTYRSDMDMPCPCSDAGVR